MAGEGNKRKQLLLQELTGGPKTLEYLVEKFGVKESSIKHDIVNLKKQGLQIKGTPLKGWYLENASSGEEEADATIYNKSIQNDVVRLVLILILQKSDVPLTSKELADEYIKYTYRPEDETSLVEERLKKYFLPRLLEEGMIVKAASSSKEASYVVSKDAPVYLSLSEEDAGSIINQLEVYGKSHPFSDQLENVLKKLVKAYYNDEVIDSGEKYEVLGRSFMRTSAIKDIYSRIEGISYERKIVEITYKRRNGEETVYKFKTGLVTYVADKDRMYMIGQKVGSDEDFVMLVSGIVDIKETDEPNNIYGSVHYMDLFYDMFSISYEPVERVRIRFKDEYNIMEKLRNRFKNRRKCTLTKRDGYIYYEDEVRGLQDLAKMLRSFGSCMEVLEPEELRNYMKFSAKRLLERYASLSKDDPVTAGSTLSDSDVREGDSAV